MLSHDDHSDLEMQTRGETPSEPFDRSDDGAGAPLSGGARVELRGERVVLITLDGEHDMATIDVVNDAFAAAEASRPQLLIVDLAACRFIDSTVIRALFLARERAVADGRELVLLHEPGTQPLVDTLLAISGLEHVFGAYRSIEQAISENL